MLKEVGRGNARVVALWKAWQVNNRNYFSKQQMESMVGWITWLHNWIEFCLIGYNAAYSVEIQQTLQRDISPPSSESKNKPNKKPAWKQVTSRPSFTLVSFLAYYSTLKVEAKCPSEIYVGFPQATWRYIPEYKTLHNHRCENLKSYIIEELSIKKSLELRLRCRYNKRWMVSVLFICQKYTFTQILQQNCENKIVCWKDRSDCRWEFHFTYNSKSKRKSFSWEIFSKLKKDLMSTI
jgi:hypothetical protein